MRMDSNNVTCFQMIITLLNQVKILVKDNRTANGYSIRRPSSTTTLPQVARQLQNHIKSARRRDSVNVTFFIFLYWRVFF